MWDVALIILGVLVVLAIAIALVTRKSEETGEDIVRRWKGEDRKRGRVL